jgi:hypothetical protein
MTIISFKCVCGNTDHKKAKPYNGSLGYEAVVCTVCARYTDHYGNHEADHWSRNQVHLHTPPPC